MDADELFTTAHMARLTLKPDEVEKLRAAVEQMLGYFSQLKTLDVSSLTPTTHALLEKKKVRDDRETEDESTERLLDSAPEREDRFIVIPNVL
jgi:aspartyl-tRNA(Asn)/glutamyl-tRNA(Gln) amidotransferase subunit C